MQISQARTQAELGFTLIEVVVALGIFGLGVLALIHAQSENLRTSIEVRDRVVADINAENVLAESYLDLPTNSSMGARGEVQMMDQAWAWTRQRSGTTNPAIIRIDVAVERVADGTTLSSMSAFRGVQ